MQVKSCPPALLKEGEAMKTKKKQWIGWAAFEKEKPYVMSDQYGNEFAGVYKRKKDVGQCFFTDIRKVKIEEV